MKEKECDIIGLELVNFSTNDIEIISNSVEGKQYDTNNGSSFLCCFTLIFKKGD